MAQRHGLVGVQDVMRGWSKPRADEVNLERVVRPGRVLERATDASFDLVFLDSERPNETDLSTLAASSPRRANGSQRSAARRGAALLRTAALRDRYHAPVSGGKVFRPAEAEDSTGADSHPCLPDLERATDVADVARLVALA